MSRSDSYTKYSWYKQKMVKAVTEHVADAHIELTTAGTRHETFVFVDAHGGLGLWVDSNGNRCLGSPVLIHRTLESKGVQYQGFVFEKHAGRFDLVRAHTSFSQWPVKCYNLDNANAPQIVSDFFGCNSSAYVQQHDPYTNQSTAHELGGLIYYDNKGVGRASEVDALTRDNRMDVLLHFSAGKRNRYAHCRHPDSHSYDPDRDIVGNIARYNRPYWYISDCGAGDGNKWNFVFLYGSHRELNTTVQVDPLLGRLEPIGSPLGIQRQHKVFYSEVDMACYSYAEQSMDPSYRETMINKLPFTPVLSGVERELVSEGEYRTNGDDSRAFIGTNDNDEDRENNPYM